MEITNEEEYRMAKQRFSELDEWMEGVWSSAKLGAQQLEALGEYSDLNAALAFYEGNQLRGSLLGF